MEVNFKKIRKGYEQDFHNSSMNGSKKLSFQHEDWISVLDKPQRDVFSEIKSVGVWLFPFYPIGNSFINFGNPFSRIGIEIIYKNYKKEKEIRIQEFEKKGWEVHKIDSIHDTLSIEDLYRKKYNGFLEDLDEEDYLNFLIENKNTNLDCLLHYLKDRT